MEDQVNVLGLSRRFMRDYVAKYPRECIATSTLNVLSVALQLPVPLLSIRIIDHHLPAHDVLGLMRTLGLVVALLILRHLCYYGAERVNLSLRESLAKDIQASTFKTLIRAPLSLFITNHSGYLQSRVTSDARMVEGSIVRLIVSLAVDSLTFALVVTCLALINWVVALLCVICLVPFACVRLYANRQMGTLSAELQEQTAHNASLLIDVFSGIRSVKLFTYEEAYGRAVNESYRGSETSTSKSIPSRSLAMLARLFGPARLAFRPFAMGHMQ